MKPVKTRRQPGCENCQRTFRARQHLWVYWTEREVTYELLGRTRTHTVFDRHLLCEACVRRHEAATWPAKRKALLKAYQEELQANRASGMSYMVHHKPGADPLAEFYTRRQCHSCKRVFYEHADGPRDRYGRRWNSRQRDYGDCTGRCGAYAASHRAYLKRKAIRAQSRAPRPCAACSETFTPSRADARFCSVRCRVRAHRDSAPSTNASDG
jgi:hypothetical protein